MAEFKAIPRPESESRRDEAGSTDPRLRQNGGISS
jgi:hypothetical protein